MASAAARASLRRVQPGQGLALGATLRGAARGARVEARAWLWAAGARSMATAPGRTVPTRGGGRPSPAEKAAMMEEGGKASERELDDLAEAVEAAKLASDEYRAQARFSSSSSPAGTPVDDAPFRKTKFDMTAPALPKHQVVFDPASVKPWSPAKSRRVGAIALKVGMLSDWDVWGVRHPLTALKFENVQVTDVKRAETHGYTALQLGAGDKKPSRVNRPAAGHFARAGVAPKIVLAEFRVSEDALLPLGTPIVARHFAPGQWVDVTGISQGKGFQGGMKRWNFGGLRASHGVSISHRSLGSTGMTQDPGRVWKGKKMAGHMGVEQVTTQAIQVYKVDVKRDIVYIRGAAPGTKGGYVFIQDSVKRPLRETLLPPFPTYLLSDEDRTALARWQSGAFMDPFEVERLRDRGLLPKDYVEEPAFEIVMKAPGVDPNAMRDDDGPEL